jgi:PAS domain S-box-containing protein
MEWRERVLEESTGGLRRLVLLLYLAVLPPFTAILALAAPAGGRAAPVLAVLAICGAGAAWIVVRKTPGPYDWIYPGGIAPVVSCGIAFATVGGAGFAFLGVMGAPIAWAAVLFEGPTLIAAWITAVATCFVVTLPRTSVPVAAGNVLVFAVIHALVAWVVQGRTSRYRIARLRSLERHLNDIELMLRADGTIVDANDRAVEAYGWSRAELIGKSLGALRADQNGAPLTFAALEDQRALVFETMHARRDGAPFPVEVSARVCKVGGEQFFHGLVRDITARRAMDAALRASEERYRSLVETMSEGLMLQRADGTIETWNPAAQRILRRDIDDIRGVLAAPQELRSIRPDGSTLTPGELPAMVALRTGEAQRGVLMGVPRASGDVIWLSVNAQPLRDEPGGAPRAVVTTFSDVTAQREQEIALRGALAAEKRFLAVMSHEIRTPLNGVLGYLDLLATAPLDEEPRAWVEKALISGRHLVWLIEDILDLSKLDAQQIRLAFAPFDLDAVLAECVEMIAPRVPAEVELRRAPSGATHHVVGDATRVRQIVVNLLGNAAKFTARGRIELSAASAARGDGRARVTLEVADTGVGIPADRVPSLFTQFRQAHGPGYGGTGLGLFLARSLARAMGGDVTVDSTVGVGSRFHVEIELGLGAPLAPSAAVAAAPASERAQRPDLRALRVLVADDTPLNVAVTRELLRGSFGIEADAVGDGAAAVVAAQATAYDLVLMDLQMPLLDGVEATRRLRALGVTTPIVAVTASALADELEAAREAGVNGFLSKPVRRVDLDRVVLRCAAGGPEAAARRRGRVLAHFAELVGPEHAGRLAATATESLAAIGRELGRASAREDAGALAHILHKARGALLNCGLSEDAARAGSLETDPGRRASARWREDAGALGAALEAFAAG